jgi:hypothetical protein
MSTRRGGVTVSIAAWLPPLALGLLLLALAGCGGDGSGPSHAPVITDLQIRPLTPEKANTQVRYSIVISIADTGNDLVGGHVELRVGDQQSEEIPILASDVTGPGTVVVPGELTTNPLPPGRYDIGVVATDASGRESAPVSFFITIQAQQLRGAGPAPTPGAGPRVERFDRGR